MHQCVYIYIHTYIYICVEVAPEELNLPYPEITWKLIRGPI